MISKDSSGWGHIPESSSLQGILNLLAFHQWGDWLKAWMVDANTMLFLLIFFLDHPTPSSLQISRSGSTTFLFFQFNVWAEPRHGAFQRSYLSPPSFSAFDAKWLCIARIRHLWLIILAVGIYLLWQEIIFSRSHLNRGQREGIGNECI